MSKNCTRRKRPKKSFLDRKNQFSEILVNFELSQNEIQRILQEIPWEKFIDIKKLSKKSFHHLISRLKKGLYGSNYNISILFQNNLPSSSFSNSISNSTFSLNFDYKIIVLVSLKKENREAFWLLIYSPELN